MKKLIIALTLAGLLVPATFAAQDQKKEDTKVEKKKGKKGKKGETKKDEKAPPADTKK